MRLKDGSLSNICSSMYLKNASFICIESSLILMINCCDNIFIFRCPGYSCHYWLFINDVWFPCMTHDSKIVFCLPFSCCSICWWWMFHCTDFVKAILVWVVYFDFFLFLFDDIHSDSTVFKINIVVITPEYLLLKVAGFAFRGNDCWIDGIREKWINKLMVCLTV